MQPGLAWPGCEDCDAGANNGGAAISNACNSTCGWDLVVDPTSVNMYAQVRCLELGDTNSVNMYASKRSSSPPFFADSMLGV